MSKIPSVVQFNVLPDQQGGYTASAVGFSIYTQGDSLDELMANIRESVLCHFGTSATRSHSKLNSIPLLANIQIPEMIL